MKRVKINAYQVALVFKQGVYQRVLTEGTYWLWNEQALVYNRYNPFILPIDLNILLADEKLAAMLMIVEVKDNEITLQYEDGLLKQVLTAGRYAFWKGIINYSFIVADIAKPEITEPISKNTLQHRLLTAYVRSVNVENYEQALLFVDGKYSSLLTGGVYYWWKNTVPVHVAKADMRQQQLEISGQEILTKDKAALRISAFAQYQVTDIVKAVLENKEYDKQLYVGFQLALREYVGTLGFDELMEKKDSISGFILERIQSLADKLGVAVSGFGIRDIILPGDVKEIMNRVLVAEKKAQANIIMRREETASTRSLLNTAKLMEENTMLWKLKEMEYVEKIAEKISNISLSGNGMLADQLKQLFVPQK
jgi:hypothetical protein